MDCPACGAPRSPMDAECPRCVYIANTLREHKLRKEQQQQASSPLPTTAAQTPATLDATTTATTTAPQATPMTAERNAATVEPTTVTTGVTPKRLYCYSCGQVLEFGVRFCKDCGASQQASPQRPAPSVAIPTPTAPMPTLSYETERAPDATTTAHTVMISIMWTLTAVEIVLLLLGQLKLPTPFLLEPPAFTMAILLVGSKTRAGRWNGGAKLFLDVIVLLLFAVLWKTPAPLTP